ncbi:2Fe-2S iron-sulfur cluster-binding protein [Streptomyces fradiae]|uniref:2Fe-2S iron-sulfur cluster-binding protein n=1 Tax=Streptomyces fradiae TaxID=1906 RepID=UPI00351231A5
MPKVIFATSDGPQHIVDAQPGDSLMSAAVRNGVPGIVAECGGNQSCATCHVWVREEFAERVGPPGDMEDDLLDLAVSERRATSRLACQITLTQELSGLIVDVPPHES